MDPTILLTAIVTGASFGLKNTASKAVQDAYIALKKLFTDRFKIGSINALEKDPNEQSFRAAFIKEINITPGIMDDIEIKKRISELYDAVESNVNPDDLIGIGVDIGEINSQKSTIINNIQGFDIGIRSKKVVSGQDTRIGNIMGKKAT